MADTIFGLFRATYPCFSLHQFTLLQHEARLSCIRDPFLCSKTSSCLPDCLGLKCYLRGSGPIES